MADTKGISLWVSVLGDQGLFSKQRRLASGIGCGGSSVVHACRVGQIFGSKVFQRPGTGMLNYVIQVRTIQKNSESTKSL